MPGKIPARMISPCGRCVNAVFGEADADRQKPQKSGSFMLSDCAERDSRSHVVLLRTANGGKLDARNYQNSRPAPNVLFHPSMIQGRKHRDNTIERGDSRSGRVTLSLCVILLLIATSGCHLTNMSMTGDRSETGSELASSHEAATPEAAIAPDASEKKKPATKQQEVDPSVAAEGASIQLTLESALEHALQNSKGIQVLSSVPQEVLTGVDVELAQFDAAVRSGAQFGQSDQQAASTIQALGTNLSSVQSTTFGAPGTSTDQLQLQQRWKNGTRAAIGYNTGYNFNNPAGQFLIVNPAWRSGLGLTVEQPLFQGARSRINEAGIRIARIRYDQSNLEFKAEVNQILHEVEVAWWRLYLARSSVENLTKIVEYAEQAWEKERQQQELGLNSVADESQARDNLEATRAQFAAAIRDQTSAEQLLRQKLGMDPASTVKLEIIAAPVTEEFVPDLEQGIEQALASRPEVKAQRSQVQMTALDVERQKDSLRPNLNLLAGYGLTGLNNNFGGSVSDLSSANYANWNLGLSFQQTLGQRAAKGNVRRSELTHTRARLAESARSDEVRYEVRESFDQVRSAFQVLDRQNARLEAAKSRFQTHRRMYEMGQLDIDRLMPSQEAYVMALRDQNTALVQYNLSINRWHYVTGQMTLDNIDG